jgi:hypothetical protein
LDIAFGGEPKLVAEVKFGDRVIQAVFSPDSSRWVAFGSWDGTVKLLDLKHPDATTPIDLVGHADQARLGSCSASNQIQSAWLIGGLLVRVAVREAHCQLASFRRHRAEWLPAHVEIVEAGPASR